MWRCYSCKILLIKRITKLTIKIAIWASLLYIFWNMKFLSWIASNSISWKRFVDSKIVLHFFILLNHIHYGISILSIIIEILLLPVYIWASFCHLIFLSYSWLTNGVIRFIFYENWFQYSCWFWKCLWILIFLSCYIVRFFILKWILFFKSFILIIILLINIISIIQLLWFVRILTWIIDLLIICIIIEIFKIIIFFLLYSHDKGWFVLSSHHFNCFLSAIQVEFIILFLFYLRLIIEFSKGATSKDFVFFKILIKILIICI